MSDNTNEPKFVRASDNEADPVGRISDDWGFWDETWSSWHGGFADQASAREGCAQYARDVLGA